MLTVQREFPVLSQKLSGVLNEAISIGKQILSDNSSDTFEIGCPPFGKSKLYIPQPLLPRGEKGSRIEVPLPFWERDLG